MKQVVKLGLSAEMLRLLLLLLYVGLMVLVVAVMFVLVAVRAGQGEEWWCDS